MKNPFFYSLFFLSLSSLAASNAEEGKNIFKTRCASCHSLEKKMVGPALKDVNKKYELAWFTQFVISSATMIASGDERAIKIFNEYNKIPMSEHKDLTLSQIQNIYEYIKIESQVLATASPKIEIARLPEKKIPLKPFTNTQWCILLNIWCIFIIVFIYALFVAIKTNENRDKKVS